jgi:hypothetical protein
VRTWGNDPDGSAVMLIGVYGMRGAVSRRLLAALPSVLVVAADEIDSPLVAMLGEEIVKDDPGQEVVLDRLLDLLVITVVRAWFARPDVECAADAAPQPRAPVDGREPRRRGRDLACGTGAPLRGARR